MWFRLLSTPIHPNSSSGVFSVRKSSDTHHATPSFPKRGSGCVRHLFAADYFKSSSLLSLLLLLLLLLLLSQDNNNSNNNNNSCHAFWVFSTMSHKLPQLRDTMLYHHHHHHHHHHYHYYCAMPQTLYIA